MKEYMFYAVLVLAGVESIFFTVATMGLCFGTVLRTVLATLGNAIIPKAFH